MCVCVRACERAMVRVLYVRAGTMVSACVQACVCVRSRVRPCVRTRAFVILYNNTNTKFCSTTLYNYVTSALRPIRTYDLVHPINACNARSYHV